MKHEPEKDQFFDLLNRAVRKDDPTGRKSKRSGGYSGKKTGQRKIVNTSKKRSGKSRPKNA